MAFEPDTQGSPTSACEATVSETEESGFRIFTSDWRVAPDLTSSYAQAMKISLVEEGQLQSILVTADGWVIDGRLRFLLLQELGKRPKARKLTMVKALMADYLQKPLSPLDEARIVLAVSTNQLGELERKKRESVARATGRFVMERLGWRKWSTRKIEYALSLARAPQDQQVRAKDAKTVFAALCLAGLAERKKATKPERQEMLGAAQAAVTNADGGQEAQAPDALLGVSETVRHLRDLLGRNQELSTEDQEAMQAIVAEWQSRSVAQAQAA